MRLDEDELVFYDYQWVVNNNVVSQDKQYVSPFFGLDISPHIRDAASFRFGIRLTTAESKVKAVVLLYVHYLDTLGIGVTDVECFIDVSQSLKLSQKFRDAQTLIFESQEFYPATENGVLVQEAFVLIYRIYPTNSFYGYTMDRQPLLDYGFEQCDTNFGEEMWSAAQKQKLTDCEFVVNQTVFPGHRAILAARCPALVDWRHLDADYATIPIVDTDEAVFEAFLYFLYTGQISLPVDADMYRHFVDLYIKFIKRLPDEIGKAVSSSNECSIESTVNLSQNHGKVSFVRRGISLEYSYECCFKLFEKPSIQTVHFNGKGSFNVSLKKLKAYSDECQCELSICNSNPVIGLNLIGVACYRQGIKCHLSEFKEERFRSIVMLPRNPRNSKKAGTGSSEDANFLEISNSDRFSFVTDLEICLAEDEDESWGYRLRDLLLSAHLWSVYTTKEWADVELCMSRDNVNHLSFPAHRAILSARSPVFASIFKATNEKKVDVEDMEPLLFEDFLFFLYTGTVRNTENLPDLWPVAKKYHVKTLQNISEFA
uniref:BTB domain-containing protein n=1 Tax=Daphnia magna TaxID=35525 RepID=A0A0P6DRW7_9CRUS